MKSVGFPNISPQKEFYFGLGSGSKPSNSAILAADMSCSTARVGKHSESFLGAGATDDSGWPRLAV